MKIVFIISVLLSGLYGPIHAQSKLAQQIELDLSGESISTVFSKMQKATGLQFSYINAEIDLTRRIDIHQKASIKEHLDYILGDGYEYLNRGNKVLIRKVKTNSSDQSGKISGYVRDEETGEELIGATIRFVGNSSGTVTNSYGFYSLNIPSDSLTVSCSYVGYKTVKIEVDTKKDQTLNFHLSPHEKLLSEVVVSTENLSSNVEDIQMSVNTLSSQRIGKIPAFMGEVDVIKGITLLPGVTTVGEGSSGFNVRGGDIDQNLVLLDEAPVYNSSHMLGFFSVFNADIIKDVKLYKGGIPSRYGGRVSSVLDIRQKDGNMKEFHGVGGIGLISSRLTLEGPIIKDKSSFIISGRRTYADLIYRALARKNQSAKVYFSDLNAKINYKINDRNRLFLSGYLGSDVAELGDNFSFKWKNATSTLRITHLFNPSLFFNTSLIYSQYNYELGSKDKKQDYKWLSQIINYQMKPEFTWFVDKNNTLSLGAHFTYFKFQPGEAKVSEANNTESFQVQNERAAQLDLFVGNEHILGDKFFLRYGIRYSSYYFLGPLKVYDYQTGVPRRTENITDTTQYKKNDVIKQFNGLEPRLSIRYTLNHQSSLKASYQHLYQYQHLISNTTNSTPFDVWKSSGPHIAPIISDQIALGYFRNIKNNTFEGSVETYYKTLDHLVDYKNGANLILTNNIETELLSGKGRAYGVEFLLRKKQGQLTGWLAYTLSRSERLVKGVTLIESINDGKYYPADYDKTHDISLVINYKTKTRWDLNLNFVYATGRPITYPDARYEYEGVVLPNYSSRNNQRLPDYHRLDLSATLKGKSKPNRSWQGSWTFSIYNLYARKNPFSIFFRQDEDGSDPLKTTATQLSILGFVFPAVTYNFKF